MKNKTFLTGICGLSVGIFFLVETIAAAPGGPQRLRGMDDRQFMVTVEVLSVNDPANVLGFKEGDTGPNCYVFKADGTWIDPDFPAPGTWEQDSVGAKTGYSASADLNGGIVALMQEGMVTPAMGGGVLQLNAYTKLVLDVPSVPYYAEVEFSSVGYEVAQCYSPE